MATIDFYPGDEYLEIHKCQGSTISKPVIDIGSEEMSTWLSLEAFSCVGSFKGPFLIP